ncbi:MAG: alpha/beta hydrolase fold domain-containing protein [Deltaproteobacteria bacterium]|nr:alpha/beta hydrolase fold domain-containing protein [Deltaproteobacteria bacterium]
MRLRSQLLKCVVSTVLALSPAASAAPARPAVTKPPPPTPDPQFIPQPATSTDAPYSPQALYPGGVVMPLYPAGSPHLNAERVREAEQYTMTSGVSGRVQHIVNIHNPSIEIHRAEPAFNTGTTVIVAAGGGHNILFVGTEATDLVPYFYDHGINTVILRNRLRSSGYDPSVEGVDDALQAIRLVRAHADAFEFDPDRIGIVGFSAGGELAAAAALRYGSHDREVKTEPFAAVSARPDFVGLFYPGPTPFARGGTPTIPKDVAPCFIVCAGSGDRIHALWANEFFAGLLGAGVPNLEMHIYGNGVHGNGIKDRWGTPFGSWPDRFIDWLRDLGFLQKRGLATKAAQDVAAFVAKPPKPPRQSKSDAPAR